MTVAPDPAPKLQAYAAPDKLVTTAWLADHLDDPSIAVVESDEDVLLYDTGHIPGAVKIDWHTDLGPGSASGTSTAPRASPRAR